jgi:hypothetical protein
MARKRDVEVLTPYCESHTSQVPFHAVARLLRSATGVEGLDRREARERVCASGCRMQTRRTCRCSTTCWGIADPDAPYRQSILMRVGDD